MADIIASTFSFTHNKQTDMIYLEKSLDGRKLPTAIHKLGLKIKLTKAEAKQVDRKKKCFSFQGNFLAPNHKFLNKMYGFK